MCVSRAVPFTVIASASSVPSTSTFVPISKLATISVPVLGLYSKAPVSSNKPFDSLLNTTGKSVLAVESVTVTNDDVPVTSPVTSPSKFATITPTDPDALHLIY